MSPDLFSSLLWNKSGFTILQNWVANILLKRKTGVDNASIVAMTVPFLAADNQESSINYALTKGSLRLFFYVVIMWVPLVFKTVFSIVEEK